MRIKLLIGSLLVFSAVEASNQALVGSLKGVDSAESIAAGNFAIASLNNGVVPAGANAILPSSFRLPVSSSVKLPSLNDLIQRRNTLASLAEPFAIPDQIDLESEALTLLEEGMPVSDVMHTLALTDKDRSFVEELALQVKERNHAKVAYYLE